MTPDLCDPPTVALTRSQKLEAFMEVSIFILAYLWAAAMILGFASLLILLAKHLLGV